LTALAYPNGQGPTLTYLDAAHDFRLSRLRWGPAAGSFNLSQFDYSYNAAHDQIAGITWHDASNQNGRFFNFNYDVAKQLLGRQQTTDPSQPPTSLLHLFAFGYDQTGNRTSEMIDSTLATATFDGANQLVAIERGLAPSAQAAIAAVRARTDPAPPDPRRVPGTGRKPGGRQ
jgi:hypothetical protein